MRRCPICKNRLDAATESRFAPFCSERCKLIDLGNWFGEGYRIEGDEGEPLDEGDGESANRNPRGRGERRGRRRR